MCVRACGRARAGVRAGVCVCVRVRVCVYVITGGFFCRDPMSGTYALRVHDDATGCLVW